MNVDFFLGKRSIEIEAWAKQLGFDKLYFVKEISVLSEIKKDESYDVVLIKTAEPEMLRRMLDKASSCFSEIFVLGMNDKINRATLESKKTKALVSPEYERKHDYITHRNSGLNQVLCKIAHDNDKAIIINFKDILQKKGKEKAILLGRIIQNIRLCRKYDVKLKIATFSSAKDEMRSSFDLKSFCSAIDASTLQVKKIISSL